MSNADANNSAQIDLGHVGNSCFIAMPFDPKFKVECDRVLKPAIERAGLEPIRGDEIYSKQNIVADIWKVLREARLVVAELSGRNPNVLYEVGLAHAIGKPVILLTRNEQDVPFDLKSLRYLFYRTTDPYWGDGLADEITKMAVAIVADSHAQPHLDGITTSATQVTAAIGPTAFASTTAGALSETVWTGTWGHDGNRHTGTFVFQHAEKRVLVTVVVSHDHHGVPTIVQEALVGQLKGRRLTLSGAAYTFIEQGNCPGYALDTFTLDLDEAHTMMKGRIPQRQSSHPVELTRVR